jgi:cytochrome c oxidase subunit II
VPSRFTARRGGRREPDARGRRGGCGGGRAYTLPRALSQIRPLLRPRRGLALALFAAVVAVLALAGPAAADVFTPEAGPSRNAQEIDSLYKLIGVIAIIVFVGVEGALFWALWKYRRRKGAVAAQIHGNTRLEIAWTAIPALILVFLTVFTFIKLPAIANPEPTGEDGLQFSGTALYAATDQPPPPGGDGLTIRVDGQQYVWRYQYPGDDDVFAYEEMVVPINTTVILEISADDVAHSWWIPELGGKADALPGYINKTWFKITEPGVFRGQCAELCGRNHADMYARVRAVEVDEYERWFDQRRADIQEAYERQAEQREAIEQNLGESAAQGTGGGGTRGETDTTQAE